MTLINRLPSWRVKVDGNVWRFDNASLIAWDALSLSPLNFDMVVTGYCLIIVLSGTRPVGRPCLVSLLLMLFSSLVPRLAPFACSRGVSFYWYLLRAPPVTGLCNSSVGRALYPRAEGHWIDSLPAVLFYSCRLRGSCSHVTYIQINISKQRKPIYTVVSIRQC